MCTLVVAAHLFEGNPLVIVANRDERLDRASSPPLIWPGGFLAPRWFWLALAVAVLVAISRVIVGAHYPTDVLGGAIVGTIGAYVVRNVFASWRALFEYRPDGTVGLRSFAAVSRLVRRRDRTRS